MKKKDQIDRNVRTMKDFIALCDEWYRDLPCIRYKVGQGIEERTYHELRCDSDSAGRFLQNISGRGRFHAGILGSTSYAYICAYFGTVNSGNVIVPMDPNLPITDICALIKEADVNVLFYDARFEKSLLRIKELCPQITSYINMRMTDYDYLEEVSGVKQYSLMKEIQYNRGELYSNIDPHELCTILFTSGTSGKSKGVMLSNDGIIDNVFSMEKEGRVGEKKLTFLPVHHAFCFTSDILITLRYGAIICVNDTIFHLHNNLKVFRPNAMILVPMVAENLYYEISQLIKAHPELEESEVAKEFLGGEMEVMYSGGAHLNADIAKQFFAWGIELYEGYGMTECSPKISSNQSGIHKMNSLGKPVNNCEVRTKDGELQVRGSSVMLGYYKNEIETKRAFTSDGWLKTGDLGYVDEDGFLFIAGRKKNLIILSSGENVSPEELENKFLDEFLIKEVLVYEEENKITAEVFPNLEYCRKMGIKNIKEKINELVKKVNRQNPSFKSIHSVKIRYEEFEKTSTNKIKRTREVTLSA